ncbi:MAG TPA: alpha/beta hydrolase [Acidimicrobiia bacterium]|nr:alpha/beta hydrolase [Acidimicrobiia bacterium]
MEVNLSAGVFSYLGSGDDGEPTVLLHAMGRAAIDWLPLFELIPRRYRLLALDMRGHGGSCRPTDYSFEAMRDDLREFADELGLDRFHLVGHSMGATTAILFAETWPTRVDRLVLEDTPPPSGKVQAPKPPDQPEKPVDFDWALIGAMVQQLNRPDPRWWSELEHITAPTLIVAGGTSSFIDQEELSEVARRIPNARLVTIDVGHHVHRTRPEQFAELVTDFLSE